MKISRLFEIVYILINKKTATAKELGEHFEVSQRTIYRDIEILCQAGIPIFTNKGKGGGICLMENFVLNKSVLSDQEQKEILSALQSMKVTSYTDTSPILSKLNSLFDNQNPDWIEVDFSNWNSNEVDKEKFNHIKDAIINYKTIRFYYYNSQGQESHRYIEPRKLIFKGQAWYIYGYCRDKKDYRYFKFSRMKALQIQAEVFTPSDMNTVKMEPYPQTSHHIIEVLLKIDKEMAYRVYDEFPIEVITKNVDGCFLIHTKLPADGWLPGYLMTYEDHIEILEPSELREEMIAKYKNVLKKYNMTS